jgi:hypothetical protein
MAPIPPRWQGVPLVSNSNSIAISVTDGEFFDGMRFARTGWPGTHGPWRVCLAMSGHALEDGLEAAGPGEVAEDSVEVCGWRREGLAGCLQRPRSLCAGTFGTGQGRPRGATVNAGARAPQDEGVRDEHSDSPSRTYDGRCCRVS